MTLSELIAALEAADGPSRELELAIMAVDGWVYGPDGRGNKRWLRFDGETRYAAAPPPFMSSIDAARTLSDWILGHAGDVSADGLAQVLLNNPGATPVNEVEGIHPRLEIAWCIAALKAREAEARNEKEE